MSKASSFSKPMTSITVMSSFLTSIASITESGEIKVWHDQVEIDIAGCSRGIPTLKVGDSVLVDLLDNGCALLRTAIKKPNDSCSIIELDVKDGKASVTLPDNIQSLELAVGDARIELNRNGHLNLNGKTIITEATSLNQLIGKPVSLN